MALFAVRLFARAVIGEGSPDDHYIEALVRARDEESARALVLNADFIAGLLVPNGQGVSVMDSNAYATSRVDESGPILMAARGAACTMLNDDADIRANGVRP